MNSALARNERICLAVVMVLVVMSQIVRGAPLAIQPVFSTRSWDQDDGLPASVNFMVRTPDGYLWLATRVGLVRFDGVRFVSFTTNSVPALGDNRISSLLVDTNGILWIGTEGGTLARLRGKSFEAVPLDKRLHGVPIDALSPARGGDIWLLTQGRGVVLLHKDRCDFSIPTTGLPGGDRLTFFHDAQGKMWLEARKKVWAVTRDTISQFTDGRWHSPNFGLTTPVAEYGLIPDRGGKFLWLATASPNILPNRGARIFKVENGMVTTELAPYPWPQDSQDSSISALFQDTRGRLWVGTMNRGVYYWTAAQGWRKLEANGAATWGMVMDIMEDQEGLIWMASQDGAIHRIEEQNVTTLHLPKPASMSVIQTACVTDDGSVWVGTANAGVFRWQNGQFCQITNGLDSLDATTLFEDSRSNLWAGTFSGLYRWTGRLFKQVIGNGSQINVVSSFCEDREGNLWGSASGQNAVFRLGPEGKIRFFGPEAGLDHNNIRAMVEDAEGQICVAVMDRGLYLLAGDHFKKYLSDRWSGAIHIRALLADAEGGLWIATEGSGLFYFKDGNFRQWTTADGLPDMQLHSVVADQAGNLWFGSNNGIFGCPRKSLENYVRGKTPPLIFWQLSTAEGLESKLITDGGSQPSVGYSPDGRLWFPDRYSLATFDPTMVSQTSWTPPPIVEEVVADGVPCHPDAAGTVRLRSGARRLEIHFTCPDLRAPQQVRFQYYLEDNDSKWEDAGERRVAYYGQLAPGDYRFRVKAAAVPGLWWESPSALSLTIVPRFWERWTVRIAAMLLFFGATMAGGWSISRARMRRRLLLAERSRALEAERARIAQDLHDELGGTLTEIGLLGSLGKRPSTTTEQARKQFQEITGKVEALMSGLDEIVWAVNPKNDSIASVAGYFSLYAQKFLELSPIRCRLDIPKDLPDLPLRAEQRHDLFLAFKEALNNVVRHSGASELWLRLGVENSEFWIRIEDNGLGLPPQLDVTGGNGLENMKQRLRKLEGECRCEQTPGGGTTICMVVPIKTTPLRDGFGALHGSY